ncbi:TPA: RNA-directed DNA polymerase [Escherichia coli]|nr:MULTISPECIES: antiviral reverse transcriptase Drt3b [Enterobacteriaceae]EEW2765388.1 RNA-directed DNA polymerase [Escherichia coli]EEW5485595.1 RNA-directed DNA polymerase [Escherichia coli]EEW5489124.1 RNA-directed DNA polymerase [Escherichia coli]EFC2861026.1 RNA-directed DNA polymerase [Escherichia coli]EFC6513078.1 RNA-directed DNA polymerase [Escherichia coli]
MAIKKNVKLDKKDYLRALLCDTQPGDCPIIFSNDGLYLNLTEFENHYKEILYFSPLSSFVKKIINPAFDLSIKIEEREKEKKKQSFPFGYCIVKDAFSLRYLSLIHPRSQLNYCEFYKNYSTVITLNASKSNYSIRYPRKVANSFFLYENNASEKYKGEDIETTNDELMRKYSSSYFSYGGFNRIYKLFQSKMFFDLEKRFSIMWMLDVSHCFDSIYTHSISWALKNKPYIRKHVKYSNQFGQELDTLMQRSNNNETNGIPIGSEFSRVFAELIFQRIDCSIESNLFDEYGWVNHEDYVILRYVDDFIVFCNNEANAELITKTINVKLNDFNLQLNINKLKKYSRPFCTSKTGLIIKVNELVRNLEGKLYKRIDGDIFLNKIRSKHDLKVNMINNIKSICVDNKVSYTDISSYLISSLSKRLILIIDFFPVEKIKGDVEIRKNIKDIIFLVTDIMLFFFSVNPTVSSSYKLSKTMVIVNDYLKMLSSDYSSIFMTTLIDTAENINFGENDNGLFIDGFISIEKVNLILAATFFGDNYLVSTSFFNGIIHKKKLDYFTIISLLFYFRNRKPYQELKHIVEVRIKDLLYPDMDLLQSSEKAHLFLDVMSCPFVSIETRRFLYRKYLKKYEKNVNRSHLEIESDLQSMLKTYWFVKWDELDLVKMIEKKELKESY